MRDHVPGRASDLPQRGGDRSVRKRAKLDDLELGAGLEDRDRLVEECQRGVRERPCADRVALANDVARADRRVRAAAGADINIALEDRDVRARLHCARGRAEDHSRSRGEQQERREHRGDEKQRTA